MFGSFRRPGGSAAVLQTIARRGVSKTGGRRMGVSKTESSRPLCQSSTSPDGLNGTFAPSLFICIKRFQAMRNWAGRAPRGNGFGSMRLLDRELSVTSRANGRISRTSTARSRTRSRGDRVQPRRAARVDRLRHARTKHYGRGASREARRQGLERARQQPLDHHRRTSRHSEETPLSWFIPSRPPRQDQAPSRLADVDLSAAGSYRRPHAG